MKIKLLVDLSVQPKHGMTKGRVLEAEENEHWKEKGRYVRWWVQGKDEKIGILVYEAEVV